MSKAFSNTDLVSTIQKENGFTFNHFQQLIETILKIIKETLGSGEEMLLS